MRPKERRPTGQKDIFQSRLDQIIDLNHPLVKLAQKIDWTFLETKLGAVYTDKKAGRRCQLGLWQGWRS